MVQTLYVHPNIRTLDAADTTAASAAAATSTSIATSTPTSTVHGALLVTNGRITALGTPNEMRGLAEPGTAEVELPGAVVLPGFHDAHIHTGNLAREINAPDLRGCASLEEALDRLRAYARSYPGTGWVIGGRWDRNAWAGRPTPTRHHLDAIFGDRPVSLPSIDGHSAWANSAGLAAAGITAATPDPVGGRIERESGSREPSGLVFERAEDVIRGLSEEAIAETLHDALALAHDALLARGITQVTNFEGGDVRAAYERLRDTGRLRLRAHLGLAMDELDEAIAAGVRTGDGDEWITTGPVKLFSDGALGSHTAHLHDDFEGDPGNHGIEVVPFADLSALAERAVNAGIGVATHAIGDRANTLVLDAYELVHERAQQQGLTLRIEHAQHLRWSDIDRFARLGVVASMQPIHCTSDYPLSVELLGSRDIGHYPWRSLLDAGVTVVFGADAPVEPADPLFGVHAAVTRIRRDGEPAGGREPEQRISVLEALRAFTHEAALAPGGYADFVALDQDPFAIDPESIWKIQVAATAVAGEIVYSR